MLQRHNAWKEKEHEYHIDNNVSKGLKKQKNLTKDQIVFKRANEHPNPPISAGICLTVVFPTVMHSLGHTARMTLTLLLQLVDNKTKSYDILINSLVETSNYLKQGNITASTQAFLKIIHQFSCAFCFAIIYFRFKKSKLLFLNIFKTINSILD